MFFLISLKFFLTKSEIGDPSLIKPEVVTKKIFQESNSQIWHYSDYIIIFVKEHRIAIFFFKLNIALWGFFYKRPFTRTAKKIYNVV